MLGFDGMKRNGTSCASDKACMHERTLLLGRWELRKCAVHPATGRVMAHYTLIVGTKNWSSWSLRPYLALRAISVPFDEEVIPLRRSSSSEAVQRRSPSGRVPLLRIEENDGEQMVWDSLAICETLADRHPEAKLWPDDSAVRAEARSYAAEMHSGFPDLREQLSMEFVRQLPTPELREGTRTQ